MITLDAWPRGEKFLHGSVRLTPLGGSRRAFAPNAIDQAFSLLRGWALRPRVRLYGCVHPVRAFSVSDARADSTTESRPWGTVVWEDRAGACGDAGRISALVEQSLTTPSDRDPLFIRADVEFARVGRRRASLFLRRGAAIAIREIDAASCEELVRASAVVIALAHELGLDPQPASTGASAPPPAEVAAPTATTTSPVESALPVLERSKVGEREKGPVKFILVSPRALSVAPLVDVATLPGVAAGVRARLARDFLFLGVALTGILLPTVERKLEGVSFTTGYAAGGLRIFRSFYHGDWAFEASVGLSLGQYWVEGVGTVVRRAGATSPYSAIETSLETAYRLSNRFRIRANLDGVVHASRPEYVSDDTSLRSVWMSTGLALRAGIGPEFMF